MLSIANGVGEIRFRLTSCLKLGVAGKDGQPGVLFRWTVQYWPTAPDDEYDYEH